MSRSNTARASGRVPAAKLAPKLTPATPSTAIAVPSPAISGAHAFFDGADEAGFRNAFESMGFTGSIVLRAPDPARRQRLLRVVKVTMSIVAAIGAIAIVRVAVEGNADAADAAPAPAQTDR